MIDVSLVGRRFALTPTILPLQPRRDPPNASAPTRAKHIATYARRVAGAHNITPHAEVAMKLLVVRALWHVCGIVDRLPEWSPEDRRWYRGGLGCRLNISQTAMRLEEHWGVEA